jgi:hypothetical protein
MDQPHGYRHGNRPERAWNSTRDREATLSCIVPCAGSARVLDRLLPRLLDEVSALVQLWEVVVVDDGLADADAAAAAAWAQVVGVRVVRLTRHFGHDAAVVAGLRAAHGDVVLVIRADDENAAELMAPLFSRWQQGADVAYPVAHAPEEPQPHRPISNVMQSRVAGVRWAATLRAQHAFLIDRAVLAEFCAHKARDPDPRIRRPTRTLRVAAVPTAPPLTGDLAPYLERSASGNGAMGRLRDMGRRLRGWVARLAPSSRFPVFEVRSELGRGLAPRGQGSRA